MNPQKQTMNTIENCTETKHTMMTRLQKRQQENNERMETNTMEIPKTKHTRILKLKNGKFMIGTIYDSNEHDRHELNGMYVLCKKITDANEITGKKFEHAIVKSFKVNGEEHKKKGDDRLDIINARVILLTELFLTSKLDEETIRKYKLVGVKIGRCGEKNYNYHGNDEGPNISVRSIVATKSVFQIEQLAKLLDKPVDIVLELKMPIKNEHGIERQTFCYHFA
jgi:hypothetical protein